MEGRKSDHAGGSTTLIPKKKHLSPRRIKPLRGRYGGIPLERIPLSLFANGMRDCNWGKEKRKRPFPARERKASTLRSSFSRRAGRIGAVDDLSRGKCRFFQGGEAISTSLEGGSREGQKASISLLMKMRPAATGGEGLLRLITIVPGRGGIRSKKGGQTAACRRRIVQERNGSSTFREFKEQRSFSGVAHP